MRSSSTAPSAATPTATPVRRQALLMPEAMPVREGSTARSAAWAIAGLARPMPIPETIRPGRSAVQLELGVRPYISTRAIATSARPPASSQRSEAPGASFCFSSGTTNTKTVSGRKRRPAPSGE